jgi:hypothetical protein
VQPSTPSASAAKAGKKEAGTDSDSDLLFHCSACYDTMPIDQMRYSCNRLGCSGCLCAECLLRLVFVTITSCLYAVPAVRCPGTCRRRIPTRVWRGGLRDESACAEIAEAVKNIPDLDAGCTLYAKTAEQFLMDRYKTTSTTVTIIFLTLYICHEVTCCILYKN